MENNLAILKGKFTLEIVVFVCGAIVMIFELVGSRITAPYIGSSIYAWTSLIGVILASLSFGYYYGGLQADKRPAIRPLAFIVLLSAVAIAFTAFTKDIFSLLVSGSIKTLEIKSIVISLILFAPASFLLGMVSPYAVRLRLCDVISSGKTVGHLYAISTAGSIVGTFLAGFYIIPNFSSTHSLTMLAVTLFLTALGLFLGTGKGKKPIIALLLLIFFLGFAQLVAVAQQKKMVADIDTQYNRIQVFHTTDHATQKPILALATDPYGLQAATFTDGTDDLVFEYTKFYRLFRHFVPKPTHVLMLGGGAYTSPLDFLKRYPEAKADVVEIDPGMTEVARKYFGLTDKENLRIYHQDARLFLNENEKKYDVIFVDVFNSAPVIPFHLTTKEAVSQVFSALNEHGVVMVNIASAIEGARGEFARAEYATYKQIFPQVYLFSVQNKKVSTQTQNIMLVAVKSKKVLPLESTDKVLAEFLSHVWNKPIPEDVPVLTDDFAPVEYYRRTSL